MTPSPATRYVPGKEEDVSTAVVVALTEAKEGSPMEGEWMLYDPIGPDALNRPFCEQTERKTIELEFTTHGAIVITGGMTE